MGEVARLFIEGVESMDVLTDTQQRLVDLVKEHLGGVAETAAKDPGGEETLTAELAARAGADAGFARSLAELLREYRPQDVDQKAQARDGDAVVLNGNGTVVTRSWFTRIKKVVSRNKKLSLVFLSITLSCGGTVFLLAPHDDSGTVATQPKSDGVTSITSTVPQAPSSVPVLPTQDLPVLPAPGTGDDGGNPAPGGGTRPPLTGGQVPTGQVPGTTTPKTGATTAQPRLATTTDLAKGLPGTSVNFSGTGYTACPAEGTRKVDVLWDGYGTGNTVTAGPDGRFAVRFTVPESAGPGAHYLYGRCVDGGEWSRSTFTVTPPLQVTTTPARGRAGSSVQVHGTQYGGCPDYGDRSVNVLWDGAAIGTAVPIRADGTFTATVTVPAGTGDHYVTGQCRDGGQWARTIFTVTP
ncbi:hypothetical protein ACWEF6_38300 [Amycolatopsis sp. NPDC004772]